jgi:protein TIF31
MEPATEQQDQAAAGEEMTATVEDLSGDPGADSVPVADVVVYYGNAKQLQHVRIPNVRLVENISYVRQTLNELVETCFMTNCSFARYGSAATDEILNDFMDLASVVDEPQEGQPLSVKLALVNDAYDVKKVRTHVVKIWDLISNPPANVGADLSEKLTEAVEKAKATSSNSATGSVSLPDSNVFFRPAKLATFYEDTVFRFKETDPVVLAATNQQELPSKCIASLALSSWNPPPSSRKLQGDLAYIELATANEGVFHITASTKGFYVNKSTRQIYDPLPAAVSHFHHDLLRVVESVSASFKSSWRQHVETCVNISIRNAVQELTAASAGKDTEGPESESAKEIEANAVSDAAKAMSVFAPLATAYAQNKGDSVNGALQWNVPKPLIDESSTVSDSTVYWRGHKSDPARMQTFICDSFGVDNNSAPRDWNEEAQSIKMVPTTTEADRISKARYVDRINNEFFEACKAAAVAVVEGNIAPLNPMDPPGSHVFVFNSIFFSRSLDGKETFKVCKGDNAARKAAGHDLRCQQVLQALEIPGLSSVMSCVIDYRGDRLIAQTIIPGVLMQGVGAARLMYGAIELGNRLSVKEEGLDIMKVIGEKFYMSPRNVVATPIPGPVNGKTSTGAASALVDEALLQQTSIRTDTENEVVPLDSVSVPHVGPIEAKLLKGSDGRIYALEFMRLTPRDANYVPSEKGGTGLISDTTLNTGDKSLYCVYVLRPELIARFIEHRVRDRRQQIVIEAQKKAAANAQSAESNDGEESKEKSTKEEEFEADVVAKLNEITMASVESELQLSPNCFIEISSDDGGNAEKENAAVQSTWVRSDVDEAVASKDEETARELAKYLINEALPTLVHEVRVGEAVPVDGASLVDLMHVKGINLRYLGRLAELALAQEKEDFTLAAENKQRVHSMPGYFLELVETELIARTLKHVINKSLNENEHAKAAPAHAIAAIFNHLLGSAPSASASGLIENNAEANKATEATPEPAPVVDNQSKKKKKKKSSSSNSGSGSVGATADVATAVVSSLTRERVLASVEEEARARFLYLPALLKLSMAPQEDKTAESATDPMQMLAPLRLSRLALLRRVCVLTGIRVATNDYDFNTTRPFVADDIIALVPVARSSAGVQTVTKEEFCNPMVRNIVAVSQRLAADGALLHAFEVAQEAHSISQQISGAVSRELIMSLEQVANVLMTAGDLRQALHMCLRVLSLTAHMTGFDSLETLQQHGRVASLLLSYRKSVASSTPTVSKAALASLASAAMHHLVTCKYLIELTCGVRHSALVDILRKMSSVFGENEELSLALTCLLDAKRRCCDLSTQSMIGQNIAEVRHHALMSCLL